MSYSTGLSSSSGYSKPFFSPSQTHQPTHMIRQPSFGGPHAQTSNHHNRHPSYSKSDGVSITQLSVEKIRRHRDYYIDSGDITFLVENYLFRVHRYFFERESAVFKKQLADSAHGGHNRSGSSDSDPMVLHDVITEDFARFLWVFYNSSYSIYDASVEDWTAILGLAYHWDFPNVKALVVRELQKLAIPPITKIVIYQSHDVDRNLLIPSYIDLCQRDHVIDFEEAKDMGLETTVMIMAAREIVRRSDGSTSAVRMSRDELKTVIRDIFRIPTPRSQTPMSTSSEDTFAEDDLFGNGRDAQDQSQVKEKPSDLPPIKTDSIVNELFNAGTTTTETQGAVPETTTSGMPPDEQQQQQEDSKGSVPQKDVVDPLNQPAGSRATSPTTGNGGQDPQNKQKNRKRK